jgi:hypothetical protein
MKGFYTEGYAPVYSSPRDEKIAIKRQYKTKSGHAEQNARIKQHPRRDLFSF